MKSLSAAILRVAILCTAAMALSACVYDGRYHRDGYGYYGRQDRDGRYRDRDDRYHHDGDRDRNNDRNHDHDRDNNGY